MPHSDRSPHDIHAPAEHGPCPKMGEPEKITERFYRRRSYRRRAEIDVGAGNGDVVASTGGNIYFLDPAPVTIQGD